MKITRENDVFIITDDNKNSIRTNDLKALSDIINKTICQDIVRTHLKEMVSDNRYTKNILENKNVIEQIADDYYNGCRDLIFKSEYEKMNNYSSTAIGIAIDMNLYSIKQYEV